MEAYAIRFLPERERPRERLREHGPDALTTAELMAVVLGSGMKGKSVLHLAQEIIAHFGSLEALADATFSELCEIKGLGPAKALQLLAAMSLGARVSRDQPILRQVISKGSQVYSLVRDDYAGQKCEVFMVVLLDAKAQLIAKEIISVGTLSRTLVHPREVFYPAIRNKAASVVIVHNHPTGDPTPSTEDLKLTENLVLVGKTMGIPVADHVIIAGTTFLSMRSAGYIKDD